MPTATPQARALKAKGSARLRGRALNANRNRAATALAAANRFREQRARIGRRAIATPHDILVRTNQCQLLFIGLAAAGLGIADHFERKVERTRGFGKSGGIGVGRAEGEQCEALAELLEHVLAGG